MPDAPPIAVAPRPPGLDELGLLRSAHREVTESLRRVEALTALDLDPAGDPAALCRVLVGEVSHVEDIRRMGVFLMNPATLEFEPAYAVPPEASPLIAAEFEQQLAAGEVGRAVRERRPVPALPLGPEDDEDPDRSAILFPIATPRQVWGLVLCLSPRDCDELPRNMLRLLTIVTNYAGMVIENASLLRTLSDQNRNLEQIVADRSAELLAKRQDLETANDRLRRIDAARSEFVSLLAHELRTPLTSILSLSEFLTEDGLSPAEVRDFAGSIRSEADRLRRLADDVLDLSRMEAGKMVYRYRTDDLNLLAARSVESLRPVARQRGITLHFEPSPGLPLVSLASERIQQVILNILSNALKFSPDGSEVTVATAQDAATVRLRVTDHGLGIAARDLPRVFNRFEQIERLDHHSKGAGCGMAISRGIIEEGHGGRIWVESEGRGKGSTFHFAIPKVRPSSRSEAESHG